MVQIRYGEQYEQADLVGKSVAEAREQYKEEFGIPDKAQARLNGKPVKKKLEADTELGDGDELSFAEKSRSRGLFLMAACLLALAITGGAFAYGYTTAGVTLGITPQPDWVEVRASDGVADINWNVFGRSIGDIPAYDLFHIHPHDNWTGFFEVRVYLLNTDEMINAYRYLNLKLELVNRYGVVADRQGKDPGFPTYQVLTLTNAEVTFLVEGSLLPPYTVRLVGGSFMAHPAAWFDAGDVSPQLWIEVTQAGVPA